MYKKFETELAGRPLIIETGRIAELTNGRVFDGKTDLVAAFKEVRGYN